jgi:gliding motility-associated-like protein
LRAEGSTATFTPIANFTQNTFAAANDTFYKDNTINTLQRQFTYKINFYVNNQAQPLGAAANASSVFLTIFPTDKTNVLTWMDKTPWQNREYVIYKKNDITNVFDSINTVKKREYRDEGLVNGKNYCYYVKSIGSYGIKAIREPLLNRSQELCAVPIDNVPPCATVLKVENICTKENPNPADTITNYLSWRNPVNFCKAFDTKTYHIYAAKNNKEKPVLIKKIANVKDTTFAHEVKGSLAGCYYVTALDSLGNESLPSNTICVDNCPIYDLPNTFTPNGDGDNDLYRPFSTFKFIAKVDMQIFNRWGEKVFETQKPAIDWDGKNQKGNELEEATYYYTCRVFEQRVEGIVPKEQVLTGFIQLIRGQ